jgi:hypothetical protein
MIMIPLRAMPNPDPDQSIRIALLRRKMLAQRRKS